MKMQPSAEIVRVEGTKCRRECDLSGVRATLCGDRAGRVREKEECDLSGARATLCGDRACRVRDMQARVRFVPCARNPLRRSCGSSARHAGESAICPMRAEPSAEIVRVECAKCRSAICPLCAQPSAEIVRVECAKCRRECDLVHARATLYAEIVWVDCAKCRRECDLPHARATLCGDRAGRAREVQARVRFIPYVHNPLRRPCGSSARKAGERATCPMRARIWGAGR